MTNSNFGNYGLGTARLAPLEIVKKAFQKETDRNNKPITYITVIGKSMVPKTYTKLVPSKEDPNVMVEVEASTNKRITLCADKRVNPVMFDALRALPEGAIITDVECDLDSKNFPETKGENEYDSFYARHYVTSFKVTPKS